MKKLLLYTLLILISNIVLAQVKIGPDGDVIPTGNYPVVDGKDVKGVIHDVQTMADRNNIPANFRRIGMLAFVIDSTKYYSLKTGVTNSDWVELQTGSGIPSCPITFYVTPDSLYLVKDSCGSIVDSTTFIGEGGSGGSGSIPSLQQVTGVGHNTTDSINILGYGAGKINLIPDKTVGGGNPSIIIMDNTTKYSELSSTKLTSVSNNGSSFSLASEEATYAPYPLLEFNATYVGAGGYTAKMRLDDNRIVFTRDNYYGEIGTLLASGDAAFRISGGVLNRGYQNISLRGSGIGTIGTLNLPNGTYNKIIPISVNGNYADSSGNITISGSGSGGAYPSDSLQTYTSGATVTVSNGVNILLIDPATLQSAITVTLPAIPSSRNDIEIYFGGEIAAGSDVVTTITIVGNTGQTLFEALVPTTMSSGEYLSYKWIPSLNRWYAKR